MSKKAVVIGLLAGAAAGALAGILLAPDKGSKTRKKISEAGREKMDGIKNGFNNLVDSMMNKFSSASEEVEEKAKKFKSANV